MEEERRFPEVVMVWRALVLVAGLVGVAGAQQVAQPVAQKPMAKDAHPSFEVATIRLSDPESHKQGIDAEGHRMTLTGQTVTSMMMFAFGVHKDQIVDGPAWRSEDKYNVDGVADVEGEPNTKQMQEMLRGLLADRFGLVLRREKKEMAYFAIVVAKGGPKLVTSKRPEDESPDQSGNGSKAGMEMKFTNNSMTDFALGMQYFADKPVVDETGLGGKYDFTLKWLPDSLATGDSGQLPGLFTAFQEQIGLKMDPKRGPVEVLVIDRLSRPTGN